MGQATKNKITLRPLSDRLIVQKIEDTTPLKGGIILPDSSQKKKELAIVIAVGNGKVADNGKQIPMPVSVGEKIVMDNYSGQNITIEDEEYTVLSAGDVIAKIQE